MSTLKTYILAPNFSLQPNGSIQIGNVIADPFRPSKTLAVLDTIKNDIVTTTELQSTLRHVKNRSGHGSVWAQFLQFVGGHMSTGASSGVTTSYEMDSLDTIQLRFDPTEEQVTPLLQDRKVQAAMNAGLFGRSPVYLITGLKIARGFSLKKQLSKSHNVGVGATIPVTDQIGVGGDIGGSVTNETEESFRSAQDIIFAYQLHVIATKGMRTKTTSVDIYATKAALLHDDDKTGSDAADVTRPSVEELNEVLAGDENATLKVVDCVEDGAQYQCISLVRDGS